MASIKSSTARPRLLLVEDDRATYTALRGILSLRGWDVVIATTIAEALEAMKTELDAVILDLILPDGDGELLLQQLRSDARARGMPVAVTTGVNDSKRIAAVKRLRPTALLRKPIALNDLLKAIKAKTDPHST